MSEWVKFFSCFTNDSSVYIRYKFLQFSLKLRNELLMPAIKDEINETIHMEKSEEASLRYVAGYIIFTLKV